MPDGLTTAAEAREIAREIVSIAADENHVVIGGYGEYETEVVARALLAALDENERLRKAIQVHKNTWENTDESMVAADEKLWSALSNETER